MAVMRVLAGLAGAVVLALSPACASLGDKPVAVWSVAAGPGEVAGLERTLVLARAEAGRRDPAPAAGPAMARLDGLAAGRAVDREGRARLYALAAEAALLTGDRSGALLRLEQAAGLHPGDELVAVLQARLAASAESRLAQLASASARVAATGQVAPRLQAELGLALADAGRHREAVVAFDRSLPFLPDAYQVLYGPARDRAWALRDIGQVALAGGRAYLNRLPLPLVGMAAIARAAGLLPEAYAGDGAGGESDGEGGAGEVWTPLAVFGLLRAAGWYVDPAADPRTPTRRADAAVFLWSLLADRQASLVGRYTARYAAGRASPVSDVPYGAPWFDAALGVVEEGVMPLADGHAFRPEAGVDGLDFYGWLLAAAAWR